MATFRWAYVDCAESGTGSGSAGPPHSIQFVTESGGATTGSANFTYLTSSNTVHLTGTLDVNGTISASHFHIENVTEIDATGSTYFGNTNDDTHVRTGSFVVTKRPFPGNQFILSASTADESVRVRGFGGNYTQIAAVSAYTVAASDYIIGVSAPMDITITLPGPSGSNAGRLLIVKDEMLSRGTGSILITGSLDGSFIDHAVSYTMTGSLPAINLYSNGSNWFVF